MKTGVKIMVVCVGIALGAFLVNALGGCSPDAVVPAADYGTKLEECNRKAKSCKESIDCENLVRAADHRPLRDVDAGCGL